MLGSLNARYKVLSAAGAEEADPKQISARIKLIIRVTHQMIAESARLHAGKKRSPPRMVWSRVRFKEDASNRAILRKSGFTVAEVGEQVLYLTRKSPVLLTLAEPLFILLGERNVTSGQLLDDEDAILRDLLSMVTKRAQDDPSYRRPAEVEETKIRALIRRAKRVIGLVPPAGAGAEELPEEARPWAQELLTTTSPDLRSGALGKLRRLMGEFLPGEPETSAFRSLFETVLLSRDRFDKFLRRGAAAALGECQDPKAFEALSNAARTDSEEEVRLSAVLAIWFLWYHLPEELDRAVGFIQERTQPEQEPSEYVRDRAARVLQETQPIFNLAKRLWDLSLDSSSREEALRSLWMELTGEGGIPEEDGLLYHWILWRALETETDLNLAIRLLSLSLVLEGEEEISSGWASSLRELEKTYPGQIKKGPHPHTVKRKGLLADLIRSLPDRFRALSEEDRARLEGAVRNALDRIKPSGAGAEEKEVLTPETVFERAAARGAVRFEGMTAQVDGKALSAQEIPELQRELEALQAQGFFREDRETIAVLLDSARKRPSALQLFDQVDIPPEAIPAGVGRVPVEREIGQALLTFLEQGLTSGDPVFFQKGLVSSEAEVRGWLPEKVEPPVILATPTEIRELIELNVQAPPPVRLTALVTAADARPGKLLIIQVFTIRDYKGRELLLISV